MRRGTPNSVLFVGEDIILPLCEVAATNLASLREGGGAALAGMLLRFVYTPSWSRDGGSLRVMELYLEFYKVLNIPQPLYSPIFLQDLVLTTFSLDYPMAPSVTFGDSSLPEGAEGNGCGYKKAAATKSLPCVKGGGAAKP